MSDTRFDLSRCEDWEDALLSDLRTSASNVAVRFQAYRREIAKCYAEIDRLKATAVDAIPAPVPTWTPPVSLPDGIYAWKSTRLEKAEIDEDGRKSTWADWSPGESYKDWTSPPETGEWQVKSGCATYLGPNEESPQ